jgi:hypothetical protein
MKAFIVLFVVLLMPLKALSSESAWKYNDDLRAFVSTDMVGKNIQAMVPVHKDGGMKFGIFLPYDQCYVKESYSEPFGDLYVLGNYEEFRLQCLGPKKAVAFPNDGAISDGIIESLKTNGNVCLIVDQDNKMCFSGAGINDLKPRT